MVSTIKNSSMINGLQEHIKQCVRKSRKFGVIIGIFLLSSYGCCGASSIKVWTVKDKNSLVLVENAKKRAPAGSMIDSDQVVEVSYGKDGIMYLVPILIDTQDGRGCYLYNYTRNISLSQKLLLSELESVESCEVVSAIFSCNREKDSLSGIGVLYGKRLGSSHYYFEGTFYTIGTSGDLLEDKEASELMSDIDTTAKAKKKLKCLRK